jgi:hypothetical protein
MKTLLLTSALFLASASANAGTILNLGVDPTSATGAFSNSVGGTTFDDQYTFSLDQPMNLTIASVTNVFPQPSDFIAGFTGSVLFDPDGIPLNGDESTVIGPVSATACGVPFCQGFAGSAILGAGNYFLDISGIGGGTSGYGGNLATFAVPGPIVGAGLPGLLGMLGLGGFKFWRRRERVPAAGSPA